MNLPLVSINIPVYKVEQYIERCLQSVVNQSYKNIEFIINEVKYFFKERTLWNIKRNEKVKKIIEKVRKVG